MTEIQQSRQLAAIFAADVVEFTRLVEQNETAALAKFRSHLDAVFAPAIARNRGRLVKLMGDGILAEFASAVEAVNCADEVQRQLANRNADLPSDERMDFRIGINVGDIIVDGDDIQGDGVVVASRLEGVAQPGGIAISNNVFEHVDGKLDLKFESLGEKRLKGLSRSVGVYRAVLSSAHSRSGRGHRSSKIAGAIAALVLALAVVAYVSLSPNRWLPEEPAKSGDHMVIPDRPSIAVLPFTNVSGDAEQDLFIAGMTADLITDLSGISGLFVIARNSSFAFASDAPDIPAVARELGVRYILVGLVRRSGDQLRINTSLIDGDSGEQLWAERYDETVDDIFALQDRVTGRVVSELEVALTDAETANLGRRDTANAAAYEAFLKGYEKLRELTPVALGDAHDYLQLAVELDPQFSRAHAALALAYYRGFETGWSREAFGMGYNTARLRAGSHMAKAWREPSAIAHRVTSEMFLRVARTEEALHHAQTAVELEPNDPDSLSAVALALIFLGQADEAHAFIDEALRLDVVFPSYYLYLRGLALFSEERFEEAERALTAAIDANPENFRAFAILSATQVRLEKAAEARANMAKYFENDDAWSHRARRSEGALWELWPFTYRSDWERLGQALAVAADLELINYDSRGIFPPLKER